EDEIMLFDDEWSTESDATLTIELVSQETLLRGEPAQKSIKKGEILFHAGNYRIVFIPPSLPVASPYLSINRNRWDVYLVCLPFTLRKAYDEIHYQTLVFSINLNNSKVLALELFPKEIDQLTYGTRYEPFPGYPIPFREL